jgi:PAS domain S-box-containing protein
MGEKTKAQLQEALAALEARVAVLEQTEADYLRVLEGLQDREARYRAILEETAEAIVSLDPDLNIVAWSAGAERIFGYAREEVLGQPLTNMVPEDNRERTTEMLKTAREEGFVRGWEARRLAKDGRLVDVEMTVTDLGPKLGFTAILRDITERKRGEEQLQKYRDQLEELHQIAIDIGGQLELNTLLEMLVGSAIRLLGAEGGGIYLYRPERDVLEWVISVNSPVPLGIELKRGEGLSGRVWEGGEPIIVADYDTWEGSHPAIRARSFGGSVLAAPIHWGETFLGVIDAASSTENVFSEQDAHLLSLFADQAAIAIRNARLFAELEASNRELDAFSHTIAHDLKAPLAAIIGYGSLLEEDIRGMPPETTELLDTILESASRMSDMIDQLLLLALLRDKSAVVGPVVVMPAVEAALARYRPQIDERGIVVDVAPDLPPALAHEQWVIEIFANLVSNAIKYLGPDNPAPRIAIRGCLEGAHVRYEVQDNGLGIAPEDQAQLFEMFARFHRHVSRGLGLGLSIVRRIVTNLNGEVGAESAPGQGSTFWFTLPALQGDTGVDY